MAGMDKPPALLFQKTPRGVMPYDRLTAQALEEAPMGQVFSAKARKGRTFERNAAYWVGLNIAVKATDAWPTASHLHNDLKRLCGYVDQYFNPLTGREEIRVQSTSFDKMGEAEFAAFFRLAQAKFIAAMSFDPWAQTEDPA